MTDKISIGNKHNAALKRQANKRIIIAGGGTGGHIFPAIAIANALCLLRPGVEILFIGAKGKMEMEKVPQAGYPIEALDITGFNRQSLLKNISLPVKLVKSFWQVRKIVNRFKPDAVVGVGGYATFPVLRYAQSMGIPSFIHESNSYAGKANIMLAKKATKIFVATDQMEKFFPLAKIVITGNPVRSSIVNATVEKGTALEFFGLETNKRTILAIGGSLGAKSINESLAANLDSFEKNNLQLIWQTGKSTANHFKQAGAGHANIWVNDFIIEMEMAYSAADLVISRSGAMSVTELCVAGKPSIFVPFPFAAEDHQTANAMVLVNKQAALLVADRDAKLTLVDTAIKLAADEDLLNELSKNIQSLAITNADEKIANEILASIE